MGHPIHVDSWKLISWQTGQATPENMQHILCSIVSQPPASATATFRLRIRISVRLGSFLMLERILIFCCPRRANCLRMTRVILLLADLL